MPNGEFRVVESSSKKLEMKSNDKKPNAPLGAYYAAPKNKLAELYDTTEWSLRDRILLVFVTPPLFIVQSQLYITFALLIESNLIIDVFASISGWLLTTLYVLIYLKKKYHVKNPNPQTLCRCYLVSATMFGFLAMMWTAFWTFNSL